VKLEKTEYGAKVHSVQ